jgi:hypothetical protein
MESQDFFMSVLSAKLSAQIDSTVVGLIFAAEVFKNKSLCD